MINIYRNKIFNAKFLSLFLCLIMFSVSIGLGNFSYAQLQYATSFSASSDLLGSGTEKDPYQITDAKHLQEMQDDNKKSSCFILLKNIKVKSHNPISGFSGTFDGNGFTITINAFAVSTINMGLFGSATNATIMNVNVDPGRWFIEFKPGALSPPEYNVGLICGKAENNSKIQNCNNFSTMMTIRGGKNLNVGGIVGNCDASTEIKNCNNYCNITVNDSNYLGSAGGIAGKCGGIFNCNNYGDIDSTTQYTGGIVGECDDVLERCFNHAKSLKVNNTISKVYVGGIVGSGKHIEISTNDAEITVTTRGNIAYVGGIAGQSNGLFCLSNNGDVTLETQGYEFWLGGISGKDSYTGNTSQLISRGDVEFESDRFNYERGNVSLLLNIGGVIGQSSSASYRYIYCDALISLPLVDNKYNYSYKQKIFKYIGSIVGQNENTDIRCNNCYYMNTKNVYVGSNDQIVLKTKIGNFLGESLMFGEETFYCDSSEQTFLKPFGNSSPSEGIKIYNNNSKPLFNLTFKVVSNIEGKTKTSFAYFDFYIDKVHVYKNIGITGDWIEYSTQEDTTYFHLFREDGGVNKLHLWGDIDWHNEGTPSYIIHEGQQYFNRGYYDEYGVFIPFMVDFIHTKLEGNIYNGRLDLDRMSSNWKSWTWGGSSAIEDYMNDVDAGYKTSYLVPIDYIGPFSIIRETNKSIFNLNLIHLGPRRLLNNIIGINENEWKKYWYGEKDTYKLAEFNLDDNKKYISDMITINNIGGYFTSNFQSINNKYYAGASSMFWKS